MEIKSQALALISCFLPASPSSLGDLQLLAFEGKLEGNEGLQREREVRRV